MGGIDGTYWGTELQAGFWLRSKGNSHLEDQGVHGKIVLKWILKK
jgi:hypothetical protein